MRDATLARWARARLFGKSPVNAYMRLNRRLWRALPASVTRRAPVRAYGGFLHRLVKIRADRCQYFCTFFFRNRPQLRLIRALAERHDVGSTLTMAFLGCSNGAELYSVLWTIQSHRPDLRIVAHAVDVSKEILAVAQRGVYELTAPELARLDGQERGAMFDTGRHRPEVKIQSWLQTGITWHHADATSPDLPDLLGCHELVLANNFLCHMDPREAERCLRNIARLVAPGGHLCVSGVDLDVRTRVALDLGWIPVREAIEDIHDGDPSVRKDWPWEYWGLEPFDRRRPDWGVRYASVFQCHPPTEDRCHC